MGRLASSIAQINNSLESVVNLLCLIEHTALTDAEQTLRYARIAQQELQRVSQIATQTRFLKQSTAQTRADMAELVTSLLALYSRRLVNSGVVVECRIDEGAAVVCFEGRGA